MSEYVITFGQHSRQSVWSDPVTLSEEELKRLFSSHSIGEKDGACFIAGKLEGTSRKASEIKELSLLVYDIDNGTPLDALAQKLKGTSAWIYSTHSHMQAKNQQPQLPRFRVIFPLAKPWRAYAYDSISTAQADWKHRYTAVAAHFGIEIDMACSDLSRLFFLPRHAEGAPFVTHIMEGVPLDIMADEYAPSSLQKRTIRKAVYIAHESTPSAKMPLKTIAELKKTVDALARIDPDQHYDDWLKIGMALKNEFGAHGFGIWVIWSSSGQKFNASVIQQKWESFK